MEGWRDYQPTAGRCHAPAAVVCAVAGVCLFLASCGGGSGGGAATGFGCPVAASGQGGAGSAGLLWIPPPTNTDGSAAMLASFSIYAGSSTTSLEKVFSVAASETSCKIVNLPTGTIHFAVTAVSDVGIESELSNIESKIITLPEPPGDDSP